MLGPGSQRWGGGLGDPDSRVWAADQGQWGRLGLASGLSGSEGEGLFASPRILGGSDVYAQEVGGWGNGIRGSSHDQGQGGAPPRSRCWTWLQTASWPGW